MEVRIRDNRNTNHRQPVVSYIKKYIQVFQELRLRNALIAAGTVNLGQQLTGSMSISFLHILILVQIFVFESILY